ncbi:MAG: hypothetical protein EBS90_10875, partial [Betaproteobacteria bacterium]|nr:hypothetical protein [Betaproteobacteria bacterium]
MHQGGGAAGRRKRGEGLRLSLLTRAEHACRALERRRSLARALSAWRELAWRTRRRWQRKLNVLSFAVATARARRALLGAA